jgi:hypothetical protein
MICSFCFSLFRKQRIKDHIFFFLGALKCDFNFGMEIWCVCAVEIMDPMAYALFSLPFSYLETTYVSLLCKPGT